MRKPNTELLQKLYDVAAKDERNQLAAYQKGVSFHFGIVSALIAATVASYMQAKPGGLYCLLLSLPLMASIAAIFGLKSTNRLYRGWLEIVTVRAKIEQQLGMTDKIKTKASGYWPNEPIVYARNLASRNQSNTSSAHFVDVHAYGGYHKWVRRLFYSSISISVVMCAVILLSIVKPELFHNAKPIEGVTSANCGHSMNCHHAKMTKAAM